ncbi:MAG TPA: hypothetical protein VKB69_02660 [Micromonosporaceae bacterium]|nr:hypothetical protein [Micromonosporaceae bacterium]
MVGRDGTEFHARQFAMIQEFAMPTSRKQKPASTPPAPAESERDQARRALQMSMDTRQ